MHSFSHPGKHTVSTCISSFSPHNALIAKLIPLIRSRCRELANFGSGPTLVRAPSSGGIALVLLESFASLSVWLPALLTFYALARWVNIPLAAHLIVGSAILCAVWARRAAPQSSDSTRGTNIDFFDLTLLFGVIVLLLLPVIVSAVDACADSFRFYHPDDTAVLSISRGQQLSFPPPDL